tara:strand:+ start:543 stop:1841 length:1299 start_codon:yes stop_codon:yes gene_type:complete
MPGALPVTNGKAIEYAIKIGYALNCNIRTHTTFSRKNYFYPDLPKGYQISQFNDPICENGFLEINDDNSLKRIGVTRAHMEEDAGKLIHDVGKTSLVDLNRCGTPLVEIVSEPDMRSAKEARKYLDRLKQTIQYIGVSDCDMEKGNLRCDANISVRRVGEEKFGTRTEIKNLNSFRFVERAINYEIDRHIELIEGGGEVDQCTMMWDENEGRTYMIRSKEEAHDYRYFPEPDIPPLEISDDLKLKVKNSLNELPVDKEKRFVDEYGLKLRDAIILSKDESLADYFESLAELSGLPLLSCKWILSEVLRVLKDEKIRIDECPVSIEQLSMLLKILNDNKITAVNAKSVFNIMIESEESPSKIIEREGFALDQDMDSIESIVQEILEKNPNEVGRFKNGESKLMGFFMGLVMRETKGKADPASITKIIAKLLKK